MNVFYIKWGLYLEYRHPAHYRKPIPEYLVDPFGAEVLQEQIQSKEHARAHNRKQPRVTRRNSLLENLILAVGILAFDFIISVPVWRVQR